MEILEVKNIEIKIKSMIDLIGDSTVLRVYCQNENRPQKTIHTEEKSNKNKEKIQKNIKYIV